MANLRQFDLDDIVNRPGTYFNPQTEVIVIIDDSPDVDADSRDELMQAFQVRHGAVHGGGLDAGDDIVDEDENAPPEADELEDE